MADAEDDPRVAIVTGGASGIGEAIARRLAADGMAVVVADRSPDGQAVADDLGGVFVAADLTKRAGARAVVDAALDTHDGVDVLVNCAGIQHVAPIADFDEDRWDTIIALMLTAPFLLTKYVWPSLQARGGGRIVNVASIHSLVASPSKSAYVSAKHGLLGLTRTAALEGGEHGITVNAICPAYVRTPLVDDQVADQAVDRGIPQEQVISDVMLAPAAIKRLIEPDEVAELVAWLCSERSRSVTGAAWTMDLGWTAH